MRSESWTTDPHLTVASLDQTLLLLRKTIMIYNYNHLVISGYFFSFAITTEAHGSYQNIIGYYC